MPTPNSKNAFAEAVFAHVDAAVANKLAGAWDALGVGDTDTDADLGRGLAIAMSSLDALAAASIDTLALDRISIPEDELTLSPVEAAAHPLVARWASPTFGEALGGAIYAGRVCADLHPSTPFFSSYMLTEQGDRIVCAEVVLSFNTQRGRRDVRLHYGVNSEQAYGRLCFLNGDAVFRLGVALRLGVGRLAEMIASGVGDQPPVAPEPPSPSVFH